MSDQRLPRIYQDTNTGEWGSMLGLWVYTSLRPTRQEVEDQLRGLGWDTWTTEGFVSTEPPAVREGNTTRVWVTVTPYYINSGWCASLCRCPLALAVNARLPQYEGRFRVHSMFADVPGQVVSENFTQAVADIINHYDSTQEMAPFSLLLVLTDVE